MNMISIIIIVGALIVCVITGLIAFNTGRSIEKQDASNKIGSAEAKARKLLDDAIKNAETAKVNALLEVKDEILKQKTDLENEIRERRKEVSEIKEMNSQKKKLRS